MSCNQLQLQALATRACAAFAATPVPPRSGPMPILYFGDINAYSKSACRIITVGKNPSHSEFPAGNAFHRFPKASHFSCTSRPVGPSYFSALNDYFRNTLSGSPTAYWNWFKGFDAVLSGFNAGYGYPGSFPKNTAIHTDLLSPVATDPVWTKVGVAHQNPLIVPGVPIWSDFLDCLEPHIVILSFGSTYLQHMPAHLGSLKTLKGWSSVHHVRHTLGGALRRSPLVIWHTTASLANGHRVNFIFAVGAQTPFGNIGAQQAASIGPAIRHTMHLHCPPC